MVSIAIVLVSALVVRSAVAGLFHKIGHEPALDGHIRITGSVGSGPFDPTKVENWLADVRSPLISPLPGGTCPDAHGNIYNPTIVSNGPTDWNVYFGGWDGVSICKDSVSMTVTGDTFATFGPHVPVIKTGTRHNLNNPNALRVNSSFWAMMYTQESYNHVNKPGISIATNGLDWDPSEGSDTIVAMDGYPHTWGNATSGADVNGGNVMLLDEAAEVWHMWFSDMKQLGNHSVFHATAPRSKLGEFTFQGVAVSEPGKIVNDAKVINGFHVVGMHNNGPQTHYSVSHDPATFPQSKVLFSHAGPADLHIVSVGLVVDAASTRLLGALYGAGPDDTPGHASLMHNRIFGQWLQKRVLFISSVGNSTSWGVEASSSGPGSQILTGNALTASGAPIVGKFCVYDSDYVDVNNRGTLLYMSKEVEVAAGDVWQYQDTMQASAQFV